jgi:hypothetical protein
LYDNILNASRKVFKDTPQG